MLFIEVAEGPHQKTHLQAGRGKNCIWTEYVHLVIISSIPPLYISIINKTDGYASISEELFEDFCLLNIEH